MISHPLNSILEFLYDSASCYKDHAEHVQDPELQTLFRNFHQHRLSFIQELKATLSNIGIKPSDFGTVLGTLHQYYENLKSTITSGDPVSIAKEIRRGENLLLVRYQDAIKHTELDSDIKSMLKRQMETIDRDLATMDSQLAAAHV